MAALLRTLIGFVLGRVIALLSRLHSGPVHRTATRRTFLRNAALGASGVGVLQLVGGFVWFWWPNKTGAFGSVITVGAEQIPEVGAEPYRDVPGKFFLVRNDDGLLALYNKCPHLGCAVPWHGPPDADNAFQCPCHGSLYNYVGERTGGPAPRPMDYMTIAVNDDGSIGVDTGDIKTRSAYDPEQAAPYSA